MTIKFRTILLAGTGFDNRTSLIDKHCQPDTPVVVVRDPHNKHDKNALKVLTQIQYKSSFLKRDKVAEFDIGFVPKDHDERPELLKEVDTNGPIPGKVLTVKKSSKKYKNAQVVISFNV